MLFESTIKFTKGDWGILSDEDKEDNDRAVQNGGAVLGFYKAGSYDIVVIMPKERDKLEIIMKHELGKERVHDPVVYDSKGIRITK